MSNRRKHLHDDCKKTADIAWPRENCYLVRAQGSRGDNLIAVEFTDGSSSLVLLPAKFRKKLWIRKGNFLIIEQIHKAESKGKNRITGSIEAVLSHNDIKDLIQRRLWPAEFRTKVEESKHSGQTDDLLPGVSNDSDLDEDEPELQPNTNRPSIIYEISEEEEED